MSVTTHSKQLYEPFRVYPIGSINKNNYNIIDLKDSSNKYTYIVLDKAANTHYTIANIGDLKRQLHMLYGFNITIVSSNKMHYLACNRFESLTPDSVQVKDHYGIIATVQLYVNLKFNQFENILKKEGIRQ